jgi:nitrous oxide reductase
LFIEGQQGNEPERQGGLIMSRRTIVMLTASAIVGIAAIATASTDALAAKKAVHHRAAHAAVAAPPAAVPVGVIDNNYGPVADRIPRCIDSVIFYPVPPCY